jgi:ribokinase
VLGGRFERHGGGKGANAAVAAARAGATVWLIGATGHDAEGAAAREQLAAEGVELSHLAVVEGTPTGTALVMVGPGDNQIAVAPGANGCVDPDQVAAAVSESAAPGRCVLVSAEIAPEAVASALQAARRAGATCVLDPAPAIPELVEVLKLGPILTPNAGECAVLAAAAGVDGETLEDAAAGLAARTGNPVVVTLGAHGAVLVGPPGSDQQMLPVPARVSSAVDTTGAGDAFCGVLSAWLAGGASLDTAVRAGVVAAGLSTEASGARRAMPTRAAIAAAMAALR